MSTPWPTAHSSEPCRFRNEGGNYLFSWKCECNLKESEFKNLRIFFSSPNTLNPL